MSLKNCIIVFWLYVMYVLGAWIFSSGYLLKRIVVHRNNTNVLNVGSDVICQNYTSLRSVGERFLQHFETEDSSNADSEQMIYNVLKTFDKAVIIIIDALRYDFTVYQDNFEKESYYQNKLSVFNEMLERHPKKTLHLKVFADPPTTTLQRLKGISTGGLPTFIDISLNFASSAIYEDNIIHQLNRQNKNVVFMGDETWEGLFPGQFYRSYPFPSFNVKDLDTVDNGILEHIYLEMEKTDWSVLIAHFVGVDHCGHRYGPSHPAMTTKLQQMNTAIRNISKYIKNDTVLVVMGDHGMTASGDHGGDSADEVATALFMYSPKSFTEEVPKNASAYQVDIVPTLSLLLGLPIPFSNLGATITHSFNLLMPNNGNFFCFGAEIDPLLSKVLALGENAFQVHNYLKKYSKLSGELPSSVLSKADVYLKNSSFVWQKLNSDLHQTKHNLKILIENYESYLLFMRGECSKIWATFNLELMFVGIVIIICTIFSNRMLSQDASIDFYMLKSQLVILGIGSIVYILYFQKTFVFTFLLSGILFMCRKSLESCIQDLVAVLSKAITFPTIVLILLFFGSMSNSYVVYEDAVLLFLVQSIIIYQFFPAMLQTISQATSQTCDRVKRTKMTTRKVTLMTYLPIILFLCLLVCIRIGSFFNKCREEQALCKSSTFLISLSNLSSASSTFKTVRLVLSWISVAVPIYIIIMSTKYTMREKNYTAAMICLNYGIVFIGICICLHWWLSMVPPQILDNVLGGNQMITARCALAVSVIIFFVMWVFPFLPEKPWESQTNHLFSGSICLFAMSIFMPLYLISIDGMSSSLTLNIVSLIVYFTLSNFIVHDLDSELWMLVVTWGLMSGHWFYCTGHQLTFPAVQWQAAFVFQKEVSSYIFAGFCITLNTFSSHIIHGITLPLLLSWNRPPKDPAKHLFKLVLKYICFHSIRLLGAIVACFFLRRHLMVWKIFTPKLIYEMAGMLVTMVSAMLSYCFTLRVTSCYHKQIKNNYGQLWSEKIT